MSLKQEIEAWVEALQYYDKALEVFQQNDDETATTYFNKALEVFEQNADTSKIFFNIGMIHATLGDHDRAVEAYTQAVKLDSFLAVAYFQMGVSNFLIGEFGEAMANFNEALLYLRGNTLIDYEQLGLKFKLFSCEVLFNRGLCYVYAGQLDQGMQDLEFAAKEKQVEDHNVIDDAIREKADGYTVFSVGVGVLYRPNESKVRNVKTKDYLGKARLVAASDAGNAFTGFSGAVVKQTELTQTNATDDRPANEISFAASNLVRSDLQSRRQSQMMQQQQQQPPSKPPARSNPPSLPNTAPANLRNGERPSYPPTPPPEKEFTPSKPVRANTVAVGSLAGGSRSQALRNEHGQDRSRDRNYESGRDRRYDGPDGYGPPRRQHTAMEPRRHPAEVEPRRAYSARNSPSMGPPSQRGPPSSSSKGYDPRSRDPRDYRDDRDRGDPRDPRDPRNQRGPPSRGPQSEYAEEMSANPYTDDLLDMYSSSRSRPDQSSARRGTPNTGSMRSAPSTRAPGSRHGGSSRYGDDDGYASDAYEGSEFDDGGAEFEMVGSRGGGQVKPHPQQDVVKYIQVKAHHNDEIRKILMPAHIEYRDFLARLSEKFGFKRIARCKVRDEDGDGMVTVSDQEDLDMILSQARREARRRGEEMGKITIWVQDGA